jgi:RNA polymerase sigma-70 factor (ECF subfamily)
MSPDTRLSLLVRVRDLADGESWREFHSIYQPLIFRYLRSLNLTEDDANDLTQEVFCRLLKVLPGFDLDQRRGRFRTFLWKLTYSTLVDRARRRKARNRAEDEWVRRFSESDETEGRRLEEEWVRLHRRRILEVVLPRSQAAVSPMAWACFEQRLLRGRPVAAVAAELGTTDGVVYVYASRVLKEVRRRCAELEERLDHGSDFDLPGRV